MDTHSKPPKLMDRVRATLRVKRYSPQNYNKLKLNT